MPDDPRAAGTSFEALALPWVENLYWVARRLTRNGHDAEDLVQETILRAYRSFGSYEVREFGIRPWLLKILYHLFLNREARTKKRPKLVEPDELDAVVAPESVGAADAVNPLTVDLDGLDQEVKAAIDELPDDFRAAIVLWGTQELSYQEIAEILGVPIGTVMSRLHRARQQLTRSLEAYARENGRGRTKAKA